MKESELMTRIRDACSNGAVRLWRNNVGVGLMVNHRNAAAKQAIITACIELARKMGGSASRLAFGLTKGSGDLIGLRVVTVTPEMVGKRVAVFASLEVKTDTGRESDEQVAWREYIDSVGGVACVARSVDSAQEQLDKPFTGA